MPATLDPQSYYRLPWSFTDNGISWLEVTTRCNLACEGCYRDPNTGGHKTLAQIAADLEVFKKHRKSDCMSIAGGDPLVHPEIIEIVRMIKKGGWKPILNTNGLALTPELLHQLKEAGVFGFTFHIDTSQKRADSAATIEAEHNRLREHFARMLAAEGGIACSFNQTVNMRTLGQLPEVVRWAQKYPDIVNTMVFILFREPGLLGAFDYYANGKKIDVQTTYEDTGWGGDKTLKAHDVVSKIREIDPLYEPCGYLNGTVDPNSFKWLLGIRVATGSKTFGWASPKFMETVQNASHFFRNRWLSYSSPASMKAGKIAALAFGLFDKGMRRVAWNWFKSALANPTYFFRPARLQAFMVIQPVDFLLDGRQNMCDSCPDITVHEGKLYWSCRLEEIKKYGCFLATVPKQRGAEKGQTEVKDPGQPASFC